MPKSFVEQALARCSVTSSKLWFNCNPDSSEHWFFKEWIQKSDEKNSLHLHFTMDDNFSLSDEIKQRYKRMYSGVFYDRYIKGLWILEEGLVYEKRTSYPYKLCFVKSGSLLCICRLRHSESVFNGSVGGRKKSVQKIDEEYYSALEKLVDSYQIQHILIDSSATSFITTIKKHGKFSVKKAKNDVLNGIRTTMTLLGNDRIFLHGEG